MEISSVSKGVGGVGVGEENSVEKVLYSSRFIELFDAEPDLSELKKACIVPQCLESRLSLYRASTVDSSSTHQLSLSINTSHLSPNSFTTRNGKDSVPLEPTTTALSRRSSLKSTMDKFRRPKIKRSSSDLTGHCTTQRPSFESTSNPLQIRFQQHQPRVLLKRRQSEHGRSENTPLSINSSNNIIIEDLRYLRRRPRSYSSNNEHANFIAASDSKVEMSINTTTSSSAKSIATTTTERSTASSNSHRRSWRLSFTGGYSSTTTTTSPSSIHSPLPAYDQHDSSIPKAERVPVEDEVVSPTKGKRSMTGKWVTALRLGFIGKKVSEGNTSDEEERTNSTKRSSFEFFRRPIVGRTQSAPVLPSKPLIKLSNLASSTIDLHFIQEDIEPIFQSLSTPPRLSSSSRRSFNYFTKAPLSSNNTTPRARSPSVASLPSLNRSPSSELTPRTRLPTDSTPVSSPLQRKAIFLAPSNSTTKSTLTGTTLASYLAQGPIPRLHYLGGSLSSGTFSEDEGEEGGVTCSSKGIETEDDEEEIVVEIHQ